MNIVPHYSTLSQSDVDRIAQLIRHNGFMPILAAVADILTQSPQAKASAYKVDLEFPPAG